MVILGLFRAISAWIWAKIGHFKLYLNLFWAISAWIWAKFAHFGHFKPYFGDFMSILGFFGYEASRREKLVIFGHIRPYFGGFR